MTHGSGGPHRPVDAQKGGPMSDPGAWPPPNPPASPPPTYPWPGWQPPQQAWWPGPPVRPPAMDRAVRLLWLGAGLTVVATVVNAVLTDPGDVGAGTSFGRGDRPLDDSTVSAI